MTDSSLQSLYPVNQIGADGFNWWVGQIEQGHKKDPKKSGRCKVRIIGLHPQSCDAVADEDLPWAITMMPVTNPHSPGGLFSVSSQLKTGHWVVGFFLDNDKQQPVIMGSVGRVAEASKVKLPDRDTEKEGCNSFTTYKDPEQKSADQGATEDGDTDVSQNTSESGHVNTDGNKVVNENNEIISSHITNLTAAKYKRNTATNSAGINFCIEKADKCGKDTNLTGTFTHLMSEMLYETQRNNGKLGTYLVGELSGDLFDAIDVGREYVDKAIAVMRSFIANIKGFVLKQIRKAVKKLTDALLRPSKDGNILTPITKFLNKYLAKVGCKMADLGDRLAKWLEDMIFGYLFNIYKATACQIDKFVGGLINKIQSLMNDLLKSILGPLQSLLGAIAKPLNMIGDAINKVLSLLGIQCSGPNQKCAKTVKVCTDCSADKREDFLDKLLKNLTTDSMDWNQYTCDDNNEGTRIKSTDITFVGGMQDPDRNIVYSISDIEVTEGEKAVFTVRRSGYTDVISSLEYKTRDGTATKGSDYEEVNGIVGFVEGQTSKTIEVRTFDDQVAEGYEDFYLRLSIDTPGKEITRSNFSKNIARCVIKESNINSGTTSTSDPVTGIIDPSNPNDPETNPDDPSDFADVTEPTGTVTTSNLPSYTITPDRTTVKEGEFVTYTITTTNVPSGTSLNYQLFGPNITPSDIVSNNLNGTFVIENNEAIVIVGINKDDLTEDEESLIFGIGGTGASASVLILSDLTGLSEEEISNLEDESSEDMTDTESTLPEAGTIITDKGGGIISIPILTSGDPYTEPPAVFITGEGYGASGEVLLDTEGFAKEIRIVDPGFGYKINLPDNVQRECIIDSFTMIRPGQQYEEAPKVFVDGNDEVAEAVINTDGQVISVRIKNRSITFDSYPEVVIVGGGGYGAKFIPSFVCLDSDARVKIGSAKVGTGSYIDCP